jgi:GNAT superfamily N-acetyltransferase
MSYLSGSQEIRRINKDSYLTAHNKTLNGLLDNCECKIVCDTEDPDLIYGFIIYESMKEWDVIHYIYIRKDFRGRGLADKLIFEACTGNTQLVLSHLTDDFKPAKLKKYWSKVIYDPYLQSNAQRRIH